MNHEEGKVSHGEWRPVWGARLVTCPCRETESVLVRVPADLSHTGEARWKPAQIDRCLAPLVRGLQAAGVQMRASCCGHGERDGEIVLQDGRTLTIKWTGEVGA